MTALYYQLSAFSLIARTKIFILLIFICLSTVSFAKSPYMDGINDFETVDPGWHNAAFREATFLYTPDFSYNLYEVDFYTDSGVGPFTLRLRADLAGTPGSILREAAYELSGGSGFQGTEFDSPVSLISGNSYWVGFYSQYEIGSHFSYNGDIVTEYSAWDIYGNWSAGPINATRPMIKFYGVPEPATLLLFGLGAAVLRRKR
jgi:hypothetical protein